MDTLAQRMEELAAAQARTEQRVDTLAQRMEELAIAQQRTETRLTQLIEQVQALVTWQRGEAGRRDGECYERLIVKRAPALFNGGQGGTTDQPFVQQHLAARLGALLAETLMDEADPFLADLIWWKGERWVVVEISREVNDYDVIRAAKRAATLRQANLEATGVVIGEEWAEPETPYQAKAKAVDWKVGADLSDGFLAFRRLVVGQGG